MNLILRGHTASVGLWGVISWLSQQVVGCLVRNPIYIPYRGSRALPEKTDYGVRGWAGGAVPT